MLGFWGFIWGLGVWGVLGFSVHKAAVEGFSSYADPALIQMKISDFYWATLNPQLPWAPHEPEKGLGFRV